MQPLTNLQMQNLYGGAITWITVLCIAGGTAAIYKIFFSGRGSVSIGPFKATWGR